MLKTFIAFLILLCCAAVAPAQDEFGDFGIPDATVGVPYSFEYPFFAELQALIAEVAGEGVTLTLTINASGNLPPGLSLDANGLFSGTPTRSGTYNFTVNVELVLTADGESFDTGPIPIPAGIVVKDTAGPPVSIDPGGLSFPLTQGSTATVSQSIVVTNRSSQARSFTANATTNSGGNWLSASGGGSAGPFSSSSISVTVNPSVLPSAGTYTGTVAISVSPGGQTANVLVVATISGSQKQIQLSQTGLRFQTVAGGGVPPPQSISVFNAGSGSLSFTAAASTVSGGAWLSVSPASGAATSGSSSTVSVNINPSGLKAGDYYGTVQFSSAGVDNSPQTASVVLNVAAAGTTIGAFVQPTGLIFVGPAGGANPAAKTVSITNPSPTPLTFSSSLYFGGTTKTWATAVPASGSVSAATPAQIKVQPNIAGVPAGVYVGDLSLFFTPGGTTQHVQVLLIVTAAGSNALPEASATTSVPLATGCTPSKLIPVFTQLGAGFGTVAAWPTPIEATVVDDCGTVMTTGNVIASFSSGDAALSLTSLRDGRWSATWQPRSPATQVTITVNAQQLLPPLVGSQAIGGALAPNPVTPAVSAGGVTSAAGGVLHESLSPGSFISIYGAHFSAGQNISNALPFPTQLGATQVLIAGRALPLYFAADGQINAIIPYDVPVNTTQQLIVSNGPAISVPEPVVITTVHPAVFIRLGLAAAFGYKPDGTKFLVDTDHPVSAGDIIEVYCTGLGPVDQKVVAGTASPVANTANTVTVTVGGRDAKVLFAGLAPGLAGVYQLDATIPSGVTAGSNVPLVISVAGEQSSSAALPVR